MAQARQPSQSGGEAAVCHGGVEVTTEALAVLPTPDTFRESRDVPAGRGIVAPWQRGEVREAESIPPPSAAERATGQPGLQVEIAALPQTPSPTSWPGPKASTGIFPADSQIAVSRTHVVVTTNDTLSFYDKAGALLQAIFPASFFLSNLSPPNGDLPAGIDRHSDVRAIFDSYRNRFWMGTLAFNSAHENDGSRLTKFLAAVSRTENPLDGWYLYWWDAVAHDGLPNDPVFQPGDAGDYPTLGIDGAAFYQTDGVSNALSQRYRYWLVSFFPADQLANGARADGWRYYDLTNPDGGPAGLIQSVVHHGQSPRTYFASRYATNELLVWALTDPLQQTRQITQAEVTVAAFGPTQNFAAQAGSSQRIKMDNLGSDVLKAVYRNDRLHLVTHDGRDWFQDGRVLSSIRLVRLNVASYPSVPTTADSGFIDRVFGSNNPITDQPSDHMHYGWPAVEVNRYGDMVVVYARSGATIFPEARLSLFPASEQDIHPSRLLKAGEVAYGLEYSGVVSDNELRWGDTAGASVDPADDTAVWVTQAYASDHRTFQRNNWALWVGKLALNTTLVPDCLGLTQSQAQALITNAGLALGRVTILPPEPPPGRLGPALVVDQSPQPGTEVNRGTRVDLQLQRQRFVRPSPG